MRIERINDMERYIIENGSVTSDKLCEVFRISKNTLLRDLNILAEKGTVKKVYGGVTALQQPFSERLCAVLPWAAVFRERASPL